MKAGREMARRLNLCYVDWGHAYALSPHGPAQTSARVLQECSKVRPTHGRRFGPATELSNFFVLCTARSCVKVGNVTQDRLKKPRMYPQLVVKSTSMHSVVCNCIQKNKNKKKEKVTCKRDVNI